jgi:hypothetical protein
MAALEHERIIQLPVPVQPLRRRRSRLGEPDHHDDTETEPT